MIKIERLLKYVNTYVNIETNSRVLKGSITDINDDFLTLRLDSGKTVLVFLSAIEWMYVL